MAALLLSGALVSLTMASAEADAPSLSIDDVTVQEPSCTGAISGPGSDGAASVPAVFTVTLDQPAPGAVSVHFRTVMSFPENEFPFDIQPTSGTLTIDAGAQSGQITVLVHKDFRYEPTEYFTVELDQPSGAAITDGSGLGTILNSNRDGFFSCGGTGFRFSGEYSGAFKAYGQANSEARGAPKPCWPDHRYEAGQFDNGFAHSLVDAVPNYLQWGAFAINGSTTADPATRCGASRSSVTEVLAPARSSTAASRRPRAPRSSSTQRAPTPASSAWQSELILPRQSWSVRRICVD